MLKQNTPAVQEFNFRVFKIMAGYTMTAQLSLLVMAFIPGALLNSDAYRNLFAASFLLFSTGFVVCQCRPDLVKRHSTITLYLNSFALQVFSFLLDRTIAASRQVEAPYSLMLGYLLVQPIIIMDKSIRITLWNIVDAVICILLATIWKPYSILVNDILNCIVFSLTGIGIGAFIRTYTISYIDIKAKEINQTLREMEAANNAKSAFLAHMSHEIRTPLNVVLGLNEMILRESADSAVLGYAGEIKQAGKMLYSLINDILDFSKIEAGDFALLSVEYNLDSVISELNSMIAPRTQEKGLRFFLEVEENIPNVLFGDERRVKQCVLNLLTNAVKYTERGWVTLQVTGVQRLGEEGQRILLTFTVTDTGIGIKPEDLSRLFSPFERLDERRNRNIEGTGLGLSIVQGILKKMDSELIVQSEYGRGSEFSFTVAQGVVKDTPVGKLNTKAQATGTAQQPEHKPFIAPAAKILVVDDLKTNIDVLCGLLKYTRIQIDTATSGAQAVELVKTRRYNVVFIDHRMPIMDGIETLHAIRQLGVNASKNACYVALTANAIRGSRQLYLHEGFNDYLSKPVDYVELEKLLLRYLPQELVTMQEKDIYKSAEALGQRPNCALCEKCCWNKPPPALPYSGTDADGAADFLSRYRKLEGIDCEEALASCGSADTLRTAVQSFCAECEKQCEATEEGMQKQDWQSYTVAVHALKTALRLVGLTKLSAEAAKLEKLGDSRDADAILAKSPAFLSSLRDWQKQLEATTDAPKEIPPEQYAEAISALKECAEAEDLHSAENILNMLDGCQLPKKDAESCHLLLQAARNRDITLFQDLMENLTKEKEEISL